MGFYIRKSMKLGPLRFNFSKSGLGISAGVKGARIGTGPRGSYIHMGLNGLYYRTTLNTKSPGIGSNAPASQPSYNQLPEESYVENGLAFKDIDSAEVTQIVDSNSRELVEIINQNNRKLSLFPLGLLFLFISDVGIPLAIFSMILTYLFVDRKRKTTVIFYHIEKETEQIIQQFYDAFRELKKCKSIWHVSSMAHTYNRKYNAGADRIIKRSPIRVEYKTPPYIKTNVKIPSLPVGKQTLYFFPDKILIYDRKRVGGLSYGNLVIEQRNSRFIETDPIPRDATIVDYTWQYVNKSGGPDRRFANNKQIPVAAYSELYFTSDNGLMEKIQLSKTDAGKDLIKKLSLYTNNSFLNNNVD